MSIASSLRIRLRHDVPDASRWALVAALLALACGTSDATQLTSPTADEGQGPPLPPGSEQTGSTPLPDAGVGPSAALEPGFHLVGAGLKLVIEGWQEPPAFAVDFSISDADGHPLDLAGQSSEGAVQPSFVLSRLEVDAAGESLGYEPYTLRQQTSPITDKSAWQGAADSAGTYEVIDAAAGRYRYRFGTPITIAEADRTKTHTIGVYATRQYAGVRYVDNEQYSFVPDGSSVQTTLDVVNDASCESCHTSVEAHGGARRGVATCVLCHTAAPSLVASSL